MEPLAPTRLRLDLSPPKALYKLIPPTLASSGGFSQADSASLLGELKSHFSKSIPLLALRVPARDIGQLKKFGPSELSDLLLQAPRVSSVIKEPSKEGIDGITDAKPTKLLLLSASGIDELPATVQSIISERNYGLVEHRLEMGYDWYSADDVLSSLLPSSESYCAKERSSSSVSDGTPTGYTTIGHIAHLNLREAFLPYKYLIGQVILEKNRPNIRTVVNKLDAIDNEFRFFAMELLAGEPEFTVTSSESGCLFTFDFRKVYFNSRLHTEHARIVKMMGKGDVVVDVMAGVGPFAIPAAKFQGCRVYANDLNPASYESLKANAVKNRVEKGLRSFCEDGRTFIRDSVKQVWRQDIGKEWQGVTVSRTKDHKVKRRPRQAPMAWLLESTGVTSMSKSEGQCFDGPSVSIEPPSRLPDHFIMNLPASALEFLDAYRGLYASLAERVEGGREAIEAEMVAKCHKHPDTSRPFVHVYTFTKDLNDPAGDICRRANAALGLDEEHPERLLPPAPSAITTSAQNVASKADDDNPPDCSLHWVRKVAPNKDMYCLSIRLPRATLFGPADAPVAM